MSEIRVMPLPKVHGEWEHEDSRYPETIKVSFSDGRVVTYRIDVQQPHPCFLESMDLIGKMKKAGDGATSTGRKEK